MRNRYPGPCYRCGRHVAAGDGHFERVRGTGWRVQHACCAIWWRDKQPTREEAADLYDRAQANNRSRRR